MNPILEKLQEDHKKSAEAIIKAVRRMFPVGCRVKATLGSARITAEVVEHSNFWWHNPGEMTVKNIKTEKLRRVNPLHESEQVTRIPYDKP